MTSIHLVDVMKSSLLELDMSLPPWEKNMRVK